MSNHLQIPEQPRVKLYKSHLFSRSFDAQHEIRFSLIPDDHDHHEETELLLHTDKPHGPTYTAVRVDEDAHSPIQRRVSTTRTMLNAMNTLLGTTVLAIPYAFHFGPVIGIFNLFILTFGCTYTGWIIGDLMKRFPACKQYRDLGSVILGSKVSVLVSVFFMGEIFLVMVQFIVLGADSMELFLHPVFQHYSFPCPSRYVYFVCFTILVIPMTLLRDVAKMSYFSAIGIFVNGAMILTLVGLAATKNSSEPRGAFFASSPIHSQLVAMGIFLNALGCHALFPGYYSTMKDPEKFHGVVTANFTVGFFMYVLIGVSGVLLFGSNTPPEVMSAFPVALRTVFAVGVLMITLSKFGLYVGGIAISIEDALANCWLIRASPGAEKRTIRPKEHTLVRLGLLVLCLFTAIALPQFHVIIALVGSSAAAMTSLVLPFAMYAAVAESTAVKVSHYFVAAVVAVIGCVASWVSLQQ